MRFLFFWRIKKTKIRNYSFLLTKSRELYWFVLLFKPLIICGFYYNLRPNIGYKSCFLPYSKDIIDNRFVILKSKDFQDLLRLIENKNMGRDRGPIDRLGIAFDLNRWGGACGQFKI